MVPLQPGLHLQLPLAQTPLCPEQSKSELHLNGAGGGGGGGSGAGWWLQAGPAGRSLRQPLSIFDCVIGAHSESVCA